LVTEWKNAWLRILVILWTSLICSEQDVHDMFLQLVECLKMCDVDAIKTWDKETIAKARGYLHTLSSSEFIAAFETVRFCFRWVNVHVITFLIQIFSIGVLILMNVFFNFEIRVRVAVSFFANLCFFRYTHDMSIMLQGTTMEVVHAYEEVKTKEQQLQGLINDCNTVFKEKVYAPMIAKATVTDNTVTMPRMCQRHTQRKLVGRNAGTVLPHICIQTIRYRSYWWAAA